MRQLMTYSWPGNIRELETRIERASLLATGPLIEKLDVDVCAPKTERLDDLLNSTEKAYLVDILARTHGKLGDAAQQADWSLKTLQRKMERNGVKAEGFRNLPDN